MRPPFAIPALAILALAPLLAPATVSAATCTAKEFADAVDQSGASLRALTLEAQPKLQERMRRYKAAMNLPDTDYEDRVFQAIEDDKLGDFDRKSSELLLRVDSLGRVPAGSEPDCAKLDELKLSAAQLNTIVKAKSDYILKRLDEKIAELDAAKPAAPSKAQEAKPELAAKPPATPPAASGSPESTQKKPAPAGREATIKPLAKAQPDHNENWTTHTKPGHIKGPDVAIVEPAPIPDLPPPEQDGYTIDEIRDATRGFFGAVSTNLAAVIEHSFKQSGRPTAYVLGWEGGGAFLAGLRFGQGTLYMRSQSATRQVYWHGPSLGTDLGASGSRTLFLIYHMDSPGDIYRNFTGVDGSAYFVGGVGLTLLKGGPVIMAPIRSGVGVRLGANVGYLRFTEQATWNPF
jgi:hypothetical protein